MRGKTEDRMAFDAEVDEVAAIVDAHAGRDDQRGGGEARAEEEVLPIAIFDAHPQAPALLALDLDKGQQAVDGAVRKTGMHTPWPRFVPRTGARHGREPHLGRHADTRRYGRGEPPAGCIVPVADSLHIIARRDTQRNPTPDTQRTAQKSLMLGIVDVAEMAVSERQPAAFAKKERGVEARCGTTGHTESGTVAHGHIALGAVADKATSQGTATGREGLINKLWEGLQGRQEGEQYYERALHSTARQAEVQTMVPSSTRAL